MQLYSIDQAAAATGQPSHHIRAAIDDGQLAAQILNPGSGRLIHVITQADLDAYLAGTPAPADHGLRVYGIARVAAVVGRSREAIYKDIVAGLLQSHLLNPGMQRQIHAIDAQQLHQYRLYRYNTYNDPYPRAEWPDDAV